MKKLLLMAMLILAAYFAVDRQEPNVGIAAPPAPSTSRAAAGSAQWRSGQQVQGAGTVSRILSDDTEGSRHQRFILRLDSGQTLLVAHNIDLAPRVAGLREGDTVSFYGEYESNPQGGVIHWTHADPQGRHVAGWLEHRGRRYE